MRSLDLDDFSPKALASARGSRVDTYLRLLLRHQSGQAVVEVSDGTLLIAAAQPLVVAPFRTAFSSGTVVKAWPKRGLPRSK